MPLTPDRSARGPLRPGDQIGGRYDLVARIACGGMAEVWEATDVVLARPVAAKILLPHLAADDAFVTRFRREAVAAARLSHPHIVSIYDTCAGDDCEAIVMELVRGRTVRDALDERGALPVRHAVGVALQVADALAHAHANGLIHRDVKPGNVLLSDDGRVLVADFGIAKAAESVEDLTEVGQVVGTAKYLSPEQVQGQPLDARSDVYSLGIVLYEMLCGRPPFAGENSTATALAHLTTEPLRPRQVRAGVPRALEDVVLRAMARRPEDRYVSADELRSALLAVDLSRVDDDHGDDDLGDPTTHIRTEDPTPTPAPLTAFAESERSWLVPATLIVVIAITLGVLGLVIGRSDVGQELFGGDDVGGGDSQPVSFEVEAFDPEGDGEENDSSLGAVHDGDPATTWRTERYDTSELGGLKPGVGVVMTLTSPADLDTLTLSSPTRGWRASVYVADEPAATLDGWGPPVAEINDTTEPDIEVALEDRPGQAVLLWITHLGERDDNGFRLTVGEIRLAAEARS